MVRVAPVNVVVEVTAPLVIAMEMEPYGALAPLGRSGSNPSELSICSVSVPDTTVAEATVAGNATVRERSPPLDVNAGTGATTLPGDWHAGWPQRSPSVELNAAGAGTLTRNAELSGESVMLDGRSWATD